MENGKIAESLQNILTGLKDLEEFNFQSLENNEIEMLISNLSYIHRRMIYSRLKEQFKKYKEEKVKAEDKIKLMQHEMQSDNELFYSLKRLWERRVILTPEQRINIEYISKNY